MADTFTTNLNLTKPEVGQSVDTWGTKINNNLDTLDGLFSATGTALNIKLASANFDDNAKAIFGTGDDLEIFHDGSNSYIKDAGTGSLLIYASDFQIKNNDGSESILTATENGAVSLYYDNSLKLATTTNGVSITGALVSDGIDLGDNDKIRIGDAQDLEIYHNATDTYFDNDTGSMIFRRGSNTNIMVLGSSGNFVIYQSDGSTAGMELTSAGALTVASTINSGAITSSGTITGATLTSSGNINGTFQGTIGTSAQFVFNDWITSTDSVDRLYFGQNGATLFKTETEFQFRNASDVTRVSIDASGNGIFEGNVTAYGSASDEKLKENISVIEDPINKIKKLKGVNFTYKKDGKKSTGLIAQDLEKVLPEAVYTAKDFEDEEHLAIRYGNTVGLLVEAIKDQQKQIEEQKEIIDKIIDIIRRSSLSVEELQGI